MHPTRAPEVSAVHKSSLEAASETQASALFPAFLKLAGRKCLVVGAGPVGQSKIEGLLPTGADIVVVAPTATEPVRAWAELGRVRWNARSFEPADLENVFLVVVATSSSVLNEWIFEVANRRRVLCNVVDDPAHCDFYYPAVVRRGALQIAISTDGKSPALAQRLRKRMEEEFGPFYSSWLEELGNVRRQLFARPMDPEQRRRMLHELASAASFEKFARSRQESSSQTQTRKDQS